MSKEIEHAITETWGERCRNIDLDCPTCQAWMAYDGLVARSKGFASGLEAAAEMVEAFELSLGRIFIERDKCVAALRERAAHEKQMAISKVLIEKDAEILRGLAGTEEKK